MLFNFIRANHRPTHDSCIFIAIHSVDLQLTNGVNVFLFYCLRIINALHEMMILHRVNYGYVKVTVNIKKEKKKQQLYEMNNRLPIFFHQVNFQLKLRFFSPLHCVLVLDTTFIAIHTKFGNKFQ